MPAEQQGKGKSYYDKGSEELAVETPVMRKRLEKRRSMTNSGSSVQAERLVIVLVGLPARGKSFIARKLFNYLEWRGNQCRIFNVGKYRRQITTNPATATATAPGQKADFFDDSNHEAARLRQGAAQLALKESLEWLDHDDDEDSNNASFTGGQDSRGSHRRFSDASTSADSQQSNNTSTSTSANFSYNNRVSYSARRKFHRIAIFDATNSTNERRQWILQECAKADAGSKRQTGVLFLESICDDQELLQENFQVKIDSCPDFASMTNDEALEDLKTRIINYEARYETIDPTQQNQQSYIKIFNLSSRLMVNHVYGRLAKVILPAIMAWNTGSRPIYLCRAGETKAMEAYMKELQQQDQQPSSVRNRTQRKRSDRLGPRGFRFRDALCEFIEKEGLEFMNRKKVNGINHNKMDTGTSIAGLREEEENPFEDNTCGSHDDSEHNAHEHLPFPCLVMSSTMPRAVETASWKHPFPVKDVTNLNPLDMGDFAGMDLESIRGQHPAWYEQLRREPFHTRFPGGESYGDLIDRLYSIIIDMEQQLGLAVAVSHVSVLQVLVSYFRSSPIQECMDLEIPMHTVLKFVPLRGGGWLESQHVLLLDGDALEPVSPLANKTKRSTEDVLIWGDSRSCLPHRLDSE